MITKDKALAFFSGSRADFNKVLPVHDKIAGLTITRITPDNITLDQAGKPVTVTVGWSVPLNGAASAPGPTPVPAAVPAPGAIPPAGAPAAPAGPNPAPGPPPVAGAPPPPVSPNDDIARIMRARRLQEVQ